MSNVEKYGTLGCEFYKENPSLALMAGPAAGAITSACGMLDTYKNLRQAQRAAMPEKAPLAKKIKLRMGALRKKRKRKVK